jgi:hypothetical protein
VLSFVKGCVHLSFEDFSKMICELKMSVCIPLLRNMRPPPIYLQLPHLHDQGLAILTCITPFQNMCPLSIFTLNQSITFHLKRSFWRSDFSPPISSKPPSPQETDVIPRSEKEGTKPPYVCPGCSNHTHVNNMINRCNVVNKRVIFLT